MRGGLVTTYIQASVAARAASSTEADPNRSICTLSLQDVDGEVQGHKAQEAMTHSPPPLRDLLGDPSAPALPVCLSLVMLTALSYPVPNTIRFECEGRAHKQTSGSARMVYELGTCRVGALGSLCHQGCSGTCIRNIYRASSLRRQPFGGLVPAVSHATFPEAIPDVVCHVPPTYETGAEKCTISMLHLHCKQLLKCIAWQNAINKAMENVTAIWMMYVCMNVQETIVRCSDGVMMIRNNREMCCDEGIYT